MSELKYKIEWPTGATAYTDDFALATAIVKSYAEDEISVEVFERHKGDWHHVYPV